jgi:hypothetical protein
VIEIPLWRLLLAAATAMLGFTFGDTEHEHPPWHWLLLIGFVVLALISWRFRDRKATTSPLEIAAARR